MKKYAVFVSSLVIIIILIVFITTKKMLDDYKVVYGNNCNTDYINTKYDFEFSSQLEKDSCVTVTNNQNLTNAYYNPSQIHEEIYNTRVEFSNDKKFIVIHEANHPLGEGQTFQTNSSLIGKYWIKSEVSENKNVATVLIHIEQKEKDSSMFIALYTHYNLDQNNKMYERDWLEVSKYVYSILNLKD